MSLDAALETVAAQALGLWDEIRRAVAVHALPAVAGRMKIDGDIDGATDEAALLREFVALLKRHGAEYSGWLDWWDEEQDSDVTATFSWAELLDELGIADA